MADDPRISSVHTGEYVNFCTLWAIPGMVLLAFVAPWKAVNVEQ